MAWTNVTPREKTRRWISWNSVIGDSQNGVLGLAVEEDVWP